MAARSKLTALRYQGGNFEDVLANPGAPEIRISAMSRGNSHEILLSTMDNSIFRYTGPRTRIDCPIHHTFHRARTLDGGDLGRQSMGRIARRGLVLPEQRTNRSLQRKSARQEDQLPLASGCRSPVDWNRQWPRAMGRSKNLFQTDSSSIESPVHSGSGEGPRFESVDWIQRRAFSFERRRCLLTADNWESPERRHHRAL